MLLVTLPSLSRHPGLERSHPGATSSFTSGSSGRGKLMATGFSNCGSGVCVFVFTQLFFLFVLNQQSLKRKQSSRKGGGALC